MGSLQREVKLQNYFPPVSSTYREMEGIAKVENPELERLYKGLEERLSDAFLSSATLQGIKRYEVLLGMKPRVGAGIEERRIEVFRRWCLTLPYTMKKLLEELNAVVGVDGFELQTRFQQYEMELHIYDQSLRVLHSIRDMVQDMIPANLLLIFIGEMRSQLDVPIWYQSELTLISECYPRRNVPYLYYDGTAQYNGCYRYDKYKIGSKIDFYPVTLSMQHEYPVSIQYDWGINLSGIVAWIPICERVEKLTYIFERVQRIRMEEALSMKMEVEKPHRFKVDLTVGYHLSRYDGTYRYNGTRRYDSQIIHYEDI